MEDKKVHPMNAPPAYSSGPVTYNAPQEQSMYHQSGAQPQPGVNQYQGAPYPSGPGHVVVTAPYVTQRMEYVEDNMVVSIVSLFFCCLLGIFAVLKASDVKPAQQRGDFDRARASADAAKKIAITAIVIGCLCVVFSIILSIVLPLVVFASVSSSVDSYESNSSY